jgi:hypothetical protein
LALSMTLPRPVVPDRILFITRRCTQRTFLLRPDDETNNAFTYLIAEAAQRFGMELILPQMMSNHHHTALYDRHGRYVEFTQHFHQLVAKSQNVLRARWENLWATEEPCIVEGDDGRRSARQARLHRDQSGQGRAGREGSPLARSQFHPGTADR